MKTGFCVLLILLLQTSCNDKTDNPDPVPPTDKAIKDRVLTSNLSNPWEILWGPDNFIWMTEKSGRISRVNPASGAVSLVHTITAVQANGEGGLLGMVLHPQFATQPYVYVTYNYNGPSGYRERVARFTYNGSNLINEITLIDNIAAASIHNGSRLFISADDKLFISTGDAANTSLAQQTASVNGKILRLNLDGTVPADNPIAGNPLWSLGHRNPQGLVQVGNVIYSSEHGPSANDEINVIEKGRNYGWPNVEGKCNTGGETAFCAANNVKEPIISWTPTIAVCGIDYYTSDAIPQWKNSLLITTLKDSRLHQLKLTNGVAGSTTTEYFANTYGRLRDICIAPDGKVYLCSSNGSNDKIIEVRGE